MVDEDVSMYREPQATDSERRSRKRGKSGRREGDKEPFEGGGAAAFPSKGSIFARVRARCKTTLSKLRS
jgi:hypothetical protein